MATWVRSGTGTAPSVTDGDLTGTYELDNATAPGDFDPTAVTSVQIQYTITGSGFAGDTWDDLRRAALTLNGAGAELAQVDGTDNTGLGNEGSSTNETDSAGIPTGNSTADWEGAELNPASAGPYTTFNQDKGKDGGVQTMSACTVTITYTPVTTANLTQIAFRMYDDAEVALADEDTDIEIEAEVPFLVRIAVESDGAETTGYELWYSRGGGAYVKVPVQATPYASAVTPATVESTTSVALVDGTATTDVLAGGSGTFVAGEEDEASNATGSIVFTGANHTELIFAVMIRKFYWTGTAVAENVDGTTFDFRVRRAGGAVLETYTVDDTPRATVTTSNGLVGGCFPEDPHFHGPVTDSNGHQYILMESYELKSGTSGQGEVVMLKRISGESKWTAQDLGNGPGNPGEAAGTGDFEGCSMVVSNQTTGLVHVFSHHSTDVFRHEFRMSDFPTTPDTWGTIGSAVETTFTGVLVGLQFVSVAQRPDGDLIVFYNRGDGSGDNEIVYNISTTEGASWSTAAELDTTTTANHHNAWPVIGESDVCHVFYHEEAGNYGDDAMTIQHTTIGSGIHTPSADPGTPQVISSGMQSGPNERGQILGATYYLDNGDEEVITVAYADRASGVAANPIRSREIRNGSLQTEKTVTTTDVDFGGSTGGGRNGPSAHMVIDSATKTNHILFSDDSTLDLWWLDSVDGADWGTEAEQQDGIDCGWVNAAIYKRAGVRYLGYVYDNGTGAAGGGQGPVYFAEMPLSFPYRRRQFTTVRM
jgi:hypothetical protein